VPQSFGPSQEAPGRTTVRTPRARGTGPRFRERYWTPERRRGPLSYEYARSYALVSPSDAESEFEFGCDFSTQEIRQLRERADDLSDVALLEAASHEIRERERDTNARRYAARVREERAREREQDEREQFLTPRGQEEEHTEPDAAERPPQGVVP
jgi:hypothetical protein